MTNATAIGFYRYSADLPSAGDMERAYKLFESIFQRLAVEPTYFSADDGQSRGQLKKYAGAFQRKVIELGFKGFQSVGLAANPAASDAPAYDSFVKADFGFVPEIGQTALFIVIDDDHLAFESASCDMLVEQLAQLWRWDFGFAFCREADRMPYIHLMGMVAPEHDTPEDRRRLELWYSAHEANERRTRVRDVFPYNVVGSGHLNHPFPDGRTLRDFILSDADSQLRPLTDTLWLWKVLPGRTEAVRQKLRGTGVVISE